VSSYCPNRGDIVLLSFDPTQGHEQRGTRPAFVISPQIYNSRSGLLLAMPITSNSKGYPFEVELPSGLGTRGVILADQVRCLDWRIRRARFLEAAPTDLIQEVQAKAYPLFFES
jgi:mRNA interferase MazF